MENGISIKQQKHKSELLKIYCYQGQPKNIIHIWKSVIVSTYLKTTP